MRAPALKSATVAADRRGVVGIAQLTETEYLTVAGVAEREQWPDLSDPPLAGASPRSFAEQAAIARFIAAMGDARAPRRRELDPRLVRAVMVAALVIGLGACWVVSPGRTALGLIVSGVFCLWALRRQRRNAVPGVRDRRRGKVPGVPAWGGWGGRGR